MTKTDKTHKHKSKGKSKQEKWKRFEEVAPKTGLHIGNEHHIKYEEFISSGGDPNSCPFD